MRGTFKLFASGLVFALVFLGVASPPSAQQATNIVFILDASGSMWGQIDGTPKIDTAKEVLIDRINDLPDSSSVGLMVFGHREDKDCADIEMVIPLGPRGAAEAKAKIDPIRPKGKTPISASLRQAAEAVKGSEGDKTIILVSDGKETCEGDPAAVVSELKKLGIQFRVHVIGFAVTSEERQQLEQIAEAGGGQYYSAENADQFKVSVKKAVAQAVAAPAAPAPAAAGLLVEKEPNNTILEPNELAPGTTLQATIKEKDTDYFRVVSTGTVRDWVKIDMVNRSTTLRPGLTLYDDKKAQMTYSYQDTGGADLSMKLVMAPGQVIYVQAWSRSDTTGDYNLKVTPQKAYDEFEPNDKAFDATKLTLGEGLTANIMDGKDTDYYVLKTAKDGGAKLAISVENGSTTLRPGATIYDRKKAQMTYWYQDTGGADLEKSQEVRPGEKYYIQVWSRSDTAGKYRLTVEQE